MQQNLHQGYNDAPTQRASGQPVSFHVFTEAGVSAQCVAGLSGCAPCRLCCHGHLASIPHAFAPAALRTALASRGKPCGLSPPRVAWRPSMPLNRRAPDRPGQRPAAWAVHGGYAGACCGRLCKCVPSPTLAVRCLCVTKDGSWMAARPCLGCHAALWVWSPAWDGARSCRSLGMALPGSGRMPLKPSRRAAESAMSPFGLGGGSAQGVLVLL